MFLSDTEILKFAETTQFITPFDKACLKPSSYTFRVGNRYQTESEEWQVINESGIIIKPDQFLIIESLETIDFPENIGGILSTRGSVAKQGVDALLTDTVIEPNSSGQLSFCLKNHSNQPRTFHKNDPIVKCLFFKIV